MRHIEQSNEAKRAMVEIYVYSRQRWGVARAKNYIQAIADTLRKLAKDPTLGYKGYDLADSYLAYPSGSHLIIYRHEAKKLYVLAVLHQSMDIGARIDSMLNLSRIH